MGVSDTVANNIYRTYANDNDRRWTFELMQMHDRLIDEDPTVLRFQSVTPGVKRFVPD
jgi:hypothetical protein